MSSNIGAGVEPVPPVVDQVTVLSKAVLRLQPSRMVQRSKKAPKQAFLPDHLSRTALGGDNRKYRFTRGWSPAIKRRHGDCRDRLKQLVKQQPVEHTRETLCLVFPAHDTNTLCEWLDAVRSIERDAAPRFNAGLICPYRFLDF
jgi:hypothetical protein